MATYGSGVRYGSARYGESSSTPHKMSKFIRDLKRDDIPTKTSRGEQIIAACAPSNTQIGDVTAELAAFTTANGTLKTKFNTAKTARMDAQNATDMQDMAEGAWNTGLENLLAKIESNTQGEKTEMGTTTVETFEPGSQPPAGAPLKLTNLSVSDGDGTDDLDLTWDSGRPRRYRGFVVRMCEDPYNQANMQIVGMPSASSFNKKGLLLGHTYWFEVAAQGSGDVLGPWSDPGKGTVA